MNKNIIGAVVLVVLVVFAFSLSSDKSTTNTQTESSSVVTVLEQPHDFGDIDIFGGKVSTTYTLKNEGTEDVKILSGVTSCMCTTGKIEDLEFGMHESSGKQVTIRAGEEKILTTTFDPLAHGPNGTGKIKRVLTLKTNSTKTPEIEIVFSGNVIKDEK